MTKYNPEITHSRIQRVREAKENLDKSLGNLSPRFALVFSRINQIENLYKNLFYFNNYDASFYLEELYEALEFNSLEGFPGNVEEALKGCLDLLDCLDESFRYIPIGLGSCLETYFKQVYADLIDSEHQPYGSNAAKYLKKNRIPVDIETLLAVGDRKFTVGEFLSNIIWGRGFEDIADKLDSIIGGEFKFIEHLKDELKRGDLHNPNLVQAEIDRMTGQVDLFEILVQEEEYNHMFHTSIPDPSSLYYAIKEDISNLFELRNKLSHEAYIELDKEDYLLIERSLQSVRIFLWASESIIEKVLT